MKTKYQIEFTKKQLEVVQEALEFFTRFASGQTDYLPPSLTNWLIEFHGPNYINQRDLWKWDHRNLAANMFKFAGEYMGIGSSDLVQEAKIAYDIYRPILELQNTTNSNVYSHAGLPYSAEGRVSIEEVNKVDCERCEDTGFIAIGGFCGIENVRCPDCNSDIC